MDTRFGQYQNEQVQSTWEEMPIGALSDWGESGTWVKLSSDLIAVFKGRTPTQVRLLTDWATEICHENSMTLSEFNVTTGYPFWIVLRRE